METGTVDTRWIERASGYLKGCLLCRRVSRRAHFDKRDRTGVGWRIIWVEGEEGGEEGETGETRWQAGLRVAGRRDPVERAAGGSPGCQAP